MHTLPTLKYKETDLEPHIDAKTMNIHYTKHHATYILKLNDALKEYSDLQNLEINELISDLSSIPESIRTVVRNNGGGHSNHSFFWDSLTPNAKEPYSGSLIDSISNKFGSLDEFKVQFKNSAISLFGSGWVWLIVDSSKEISIIGTPNQDSPLMGDSIVTKGGEPLIGIDLWEHAYYLNFQNRRPDYVDAFWNVLDWDVVQKRYDNI